MKNTLYITIVCILFIQCSNNDDSETTTTMTDIEGNIYNTIKIGNQTWMLENLKTTKFNDGTPITEYTFETHGNNWLNLNTPEQLFLWPNTDDLNDVVEPELPFDYYGAMYNHLTIESGKLAPQGWKIPSKQDFIELENYLSNNGFAGVEAKTLKSTSGWLASSGNGTNNIGFNGLPNGYVSAFGTSTLSEGVCTWATTNTNTTNSTRTLVQLFNTNEVLYSENAFQIGAAIRCIKE